EFPGVDDQVVRRAGYGYVGSVVQGTRTMGSVPLDFVAEYSGGTRVVLELRGAGNGSLITAPATTGLDSPFACHTATPAVRLGTPGTAGAAVAALAVGGFVAVGAQDAEFADGGAGDLIVAEALLARGGAVRAGIGDIEEVLVGRGRGGGAVVEI